MTVSFYKSMDRRDFLKTGLAAMGVITAGCAGYRLPLYKSKTNVTHWAFLADTHIPQDINENYRDFYPYQNLQKVVPELISYSPDGVAIAGDLARLEGKTGDYENLKKLLTPLAEKIPIYMALGNHDNRQNFLQVFDKTPGEKQSVAGKHVVVVNKPPIRLIILDSLFYVNKVPGLLGKAQRQWLENYLRNCDNTPTILCLHHTLGEGDGELFDAPYLLRIVKSIRKVKAIVYGHSHEYRFSKYKGIHLINLPAMGYNFNDNEPVGWVQARLTARRGDFTLHAVAGNKVNDGSTRRLTWRR